MRVRRFSEVISAAHDGALWTEGQLRRTMCEFPDCVKKSDARPGAQHAANRGGSIPCIAARFEEVIEVCFPLGTWEYVFGWHAPEGALSCLWVDATIERDENGVGMRGFSPTGLVDPRKRMLCGGCVFA